LHCLDGVSFTVPGVLVWMSKVSGPKGMMLRKTVLCSASTMGPPGKQVPVLIMFQHYNMLMPHPGSVSQGKQARVSTVEWFSGGPQAILWPRRRPRVVLASSLSAASWYHGHYLAGSPMSDGTERRADRKYDSYRDVVGALFLKRQITLHG
jgi:hypothetical protein